MPASDPEHPSEEIPSAAPDGETSSQEAKGTTDGAAQWLVGKWRSLSNRTRRVLTIGSIGAFLGVLVQSTTLVEKVTVLVSPHLRSQTSFTMASANDNTILIHVSNTGGKPSTLLDYRLNFGTLPIENRTLHPIEDDRSKAVIPAHGDVVIRLTTLGLRARPRDDGMPGRFGRADIDGLMNGQEVTLVIDVKESDDPKRGHLWNLSKPRKFHTAVDAFPADRIRDFILHWLPAHDVREEHNVL
jgi:hypothetical protein